MRVFGIKLAMPNERHLIPANADTPDPLAAAIATAEDYDRFSAGLISPPPAILATVQRDMAALAAAHMERIRGEWQAELALRRLVGA